MISGGTFFPEAETGKNSAPLGQPPSSPQTRRHRSTAPAPLSCSIPNPYPQPTDPTLPSGPTKNTLNIIHLALLFPHPLPQHFHNSTFQQARATATAAHLAKTNNRCLSVSSPTMKMRLPVTARHRNWPCSLGFLALGGGGARKSGVEAEGHWAAMSPQIDGPVKGRYKKAIPAPPPTSRLPRPSCLHAPHFPHFPTTPRSPPPI